MDYMQQAIEEARAGIRNKEGGPFGSVIVKDGAIVGRGHNQVLLLHDPTCHGEMQAIRSASKRLGTHDLSGCILYTTAEPCPMCLGGILWANIRTVYYGCNRHDTDAIGFRDDVFYDSFYGKNSLVSVQESDRQQCMELFAEYEGIAGGKRY